LGEKQPEGIAVKGSLLQVPAGETLSVVGGDIQIADGSLYAPGGRIDMVSVASPGEVLPNAPDLGVASFERLGRIEVSHSSSKRPRIAGNFIGNVDTSGEGGGRIFIRGGELVADNAWIWSDTRGGGEGQGIDIEVTGQVTMRNGASITADTLGSGSGGDLTVKADKMFLSGDFTDILARALGGVSSDLGDITVTAGSLEVRNGAGIHTSPFVQGEGGDVTVTADRVLLSGDGEFLTGISSGGEIFSGGILPGGGGAGNVTVTAGSLEVRNGAGISAEGSGVLVVGNTPVAPGITRRGGNVTVTADRVLLSGDGTTSTGITTAGFEIDTRFGPLRIDAGNVTIQAGSLEVHNGAVISSSFSGNEGQGGNVTVTADRVFLSGAGANFESPTGIFAGAIGGSAGDVVVTAGNLEVRNGAVISASTLGGGSGGNVTVEADRVFLSGDGASFAGEVVDSFFEIFGRVPRLTGIAALTGATGQGGNVTVTATDITLQDGARISAESRRFFSVGTQANAGNIILEVGNLLHLSNDSSITTSVTGGIGKGGNITLNSVFVVLDEGSRIIANAEGGPGGNILIHIHGGGALFQSPNSLIDASSEFGIDGSVVIDAPDTDIIAGFAGLPANFLDAATVLTQLCAGRSGANVSSLVVRKYEVLPDSPYALRVQLPRAIPAPRTAKKSRAPHTYYAGSPLPPIISCLGNG
jgi:large exoprotein involved in heme utilization and adhesion